MCGEIAVWAPAVDDSAQCTAVSVYTNEVPRLPSEALGERRFQGQRGSAGVPDVVKFTRHYKLIELRDTRWLGDM